MEIGMGHGNSRETIVSSIETMWQKKKAEIVEFSQWLRKRRALTISCSRLFKILPLLSMGSSLWKDDTSSLLWYQTWPVDFFWPMACEKKWCVPLPTESFQNPYGIYCHMAFLCLRASNVPNMRDPLAWVPEWRRHLANPLWSHNTSQK